MISPEAERSRPGTDEAFADAVTFAFGDDEAELFGLARIGFSPAAGALNPLAVVFAGREPVAAIARGGGRAHAVDWRARAAGGGRARGPQTLPRRAVGSRGLGPLRPAGTDGHEDEAVSAVLVETDPAHPEEAPESHPVSRPRLSTTYDGEGHQRRAGLELWVDEEDQLPRRAGGTAVCGTTLDLGRLRLDTAFFSWSMEGHTGLGRYDVVRRAGA